MSGSTTARGYGAEHQRIREALLPYAYGTDCHLCGKPMQPGQALHLDHTPDRTAYRGFTHAWCNRLDGARRGAERSRGKPTTWTTTRQW